MPRPMPGMRQSRPLRPALRPPLAGLPLRAALAMFAGILIGRVTAPRRPVHSLEISIPSLPGAQSPAPAPAPAAPAAPPASAPAAPPAPAPPCQAPYEETTPPTKWTMSADHFGPFSRCTTQLDLAYVKSVLPGFDVVEEPEPYFPNRPYFKVTHRGRPFLSIWPPTTDGSPGLRVSIHTPVIETPWRVRAGDSVGTLAAHHRDLTCMYGAAEGSEGLWCRRISTGDGWVDTLQYTISMRPLGADRSRVRGEIDTARIAHLRIESIDWQPAPAAP